jgi:ribosome biogenesis protein SSF1/2
VSFSNSKRQRVLIEELLVEFRHYDISLQAVGLSRTVKSVLRSNLPNLAKFDDISDYILS